MAKKIKKQLKFAGMYFALLFAPILRLILFIIDFIWESYSLFYGSIREKKNIPF